MDGSRYLRDLQVTVEPVGRLQGYAGNAKAHTARQVSQIANSIREFGFNDPIGVWTNAEGKSEVVEGHGRLMAAAELGMAEVPVVHLDGLTDAQRRAYVLAHNQLTMSTGWDLDRLAEEMDGLAGDYDMTDLGFDFSGAEEEIDAYKSSLSTEGRDGDDAYGEFVDKFKPKLTTDDCYTPQAVYDAVRDWACAEYGLEPSDIVRPFKPGGDYAAEEYPDGCVVLDNPPFSILSEIIDFYSARGIRFFLFGPNLTLFSGRGRANYVDVNAHVVYENGAVVNTGFITNMGEWKIDTAPDLYDAIKAAQESDAQKTRKITYPPELVTAASLGKLSKRGVRWRVRAEECEFVKKLDAMDGGGIYGGGFLVSESAAAERIKAERAAERIKEYGSETREPDSVYELSDRERAIVASLATRGRGDE